MTRVISGNEVIENWPFRPEDLAAVKGKRVVIIQAGENCASDIYVRNKCKKLAEYGMISCREFFPKESVEDMLKRIISTITQANQDPNVIGIMCQLPLYSELKPYEGFILSAISSEKDIDNISDVNFGLCLANAHREKRTGMSYVPATPRGIVHILNTIQKVEDYHGKKAVVLGRSRLVGLPIAAILQRKDLYNMTVTVLHTGSDMGDIIRYTKDADVVIAAIGNPRFIDETMIKDGAIVIDAGTNYVDGHLIGDVDFENVAPKCSAITPVPGGVGKVTVHALMHNIIDGQFDK